MSFDRDKHVQIIGEGEARFVTPRQAKKLLADGKIVPGDMPDQFIAQDPDLDTLVSYTRGGKDG